MAEFEERIFYTGAEHQMCETCLFSHEEVVSTRASEVQTWRCRRDPRELRVHADYWCGQWRQGAKRQG